MISRFLILALALCSADAAVKTKAELATISTNAAASKTAWYDAYYHKLWTSWCAAGMGGADEAVDEVASCQADQADDDDWKQEVEWRWRGAATGWVEGTTDCALDEGFCTRAGATSFDTLFGNAIAAGEGGDFTEESAIRCMQAEVEDDTGHGSDDMVMCPDEDESSCPEGGGSFCCCADTLDAESCRKAATPDARCTGGSAAYANPSYPSSAAVCPTGIVDLIPAVDAFNFSAHPDIMLEAAALASRPAFRAINYGAINFSNPNPVYDACENVLFEPNNKGSLVIDGSATASYLIINPNNAPVAGESLRIAAGDARIYGGVNSGPGPIFVTTPGTVVVAQLANSGTVSVAGGTDVSVVSVSNTGDIDVTDSVASIYDVTNGGNLDISGGTYAIYDTTSAGTITVYGATVTAAGVTNAGTITATAVTGTMSVDSNTGTITCAGCALDLVVYDNTGGTIDLSDVGNTGSVTINGGSQGTITVNDAVTLTVVGMSSAVLTQELSFTGVTAATFDDAAAVASVESAIATTLGVSASRVSVTGYEDVTTLRRRAVRRALLAAGVTLTYTVSFSTTDADQAALETTMTAMTTDASALATVTTAVASAAGVDESTVTASAADVSVDAGGVSAAARSARAATLAACVVAAAALLL